MNKKLYILSLSLVILVVFTSALFLSAQTSFARSSPSCGVDDAVPSTKQGFPTCTSVAVDQLGFQIPTLGDILTFAIRAFFVIAGLAALFFMLIGAFAWVTSGGDKEAVGAARDKIQAAVVGMILIVAVLAIIWTLEQVVFKRRICMGLSCPLTLPGILEVDSTATNCCRCIITEGANKGELGDVIDTYTHKCAADGGAIDFNQ